MCGITGVMNARQSGEDLRSCALRMADTLAHRGPDDAGVWVEPEAGLALAHRRLSILDLSPQGHQPMASACGRYQIVFNGEIYNHAELRLALEQAGVRGWRGHSDTEVMLAAIVAWGLSDALRRFVGMFAFALWDRTRRTLSLARDRIGEKPLYYGFSGGVFLFASELKALRAYPGFTAQIDRDALALMQRLAYIPAPHTIYRGIRKLLPGSFLTLPLDCRSLPEPVRYWSATEVAEQGQRNPFQGSEAEALAEVERLLGDAIARQMVADVPLGAFLSGGVDSSAILALMQARSMRPVQSFTVGFWEPAFNEAQHAKEVAAHLGTQHHEIYVTPQQALDVVPRLPGIYDEPYGDSSQIPTYLVSQLARQHVTVSLSGDGGDELFGGYNRYFWAKNLWRRMGWLPESLRRLLAMAITTPSPTAWDRLFRGVSPVLPAALRYQNPGDKMHKLAQILTARNPEAIYWGLVSLWQDPERLVLGGHEPISAFNDDAQQADLREFEHWMMHKDILTYLPDDILVKVDRAAMAVSLETRLPLLDHALVTFVWSLPLGMKIRGSERKWLLRKLLYRYVPSEMIERPKMGFGIPLAEWLRGPLRAWCEALLEPGRLRNEGYFDPERVQRYWREHLSGNRNWAYHLWNVIAFQAWLEATHGS